MRSVFIASAVRTAIGKFGGALASLSAVDLGVIAVEGALARAGIEAFAVNLLGYGLSSRFELDDPCSTNQTDQRRLLVSATGQPLFEAEDNVLQDSCSCVIKVASSD